MRRWWVVIGLLLVLWASRIHNLDSLPLHVDETVHLNRAIEVWHGHPFWEISDGRIVNHWAIAVFYPQNAPVFVARVATILVAMPGFAAGYALARRWFGRSAGLLAAVLWMTCPYMFFYERTALADAEAGALAVLAIWATLRLSRSGRHRDAALAGLALAVALLFKLTAAPFVLSVGLLVLFFGKTPWRQRWGHVLLIALTVLLCFAVPLLYAATHRGFGIAADWLAGSGGHGLTLDANLDMLWAQGVDYGSWIWSLFLGVGLMGVALGPLPMRFRDGSHRGRTDTLLLIGAAALPLVFVLVAVAFAMPRHLLVGVPILLTLGGAGLGLLIDQISHRFPQSEWWRSALSGVLIATLAIGFVPFARAAYNAPNTLPLPPIERGQYLTGYSAGFGLREAVQAFPATIGPPGVPVIASMYPDSCKLANFYDTIGYNMACPTAPGLSEIKAALQRQDTVYVLAEKPPIGLRFDRLDLPAVRIAAYPRPGETGQTASVTLWRLSNP